MQKCVYRCGILDRCKVKGKMRANVHLVGPSLKSCLRTQLKAVGGLMRVCFVDADAPCSLALIPECDRRKLHFSVIILCFLFEASVSVF